MTMISKRIKGAFAKPITGDRLKWWYIICITFLFGRKLTVEGAERRSRVFPFIWGGKLYLFGMQHYGARILFDRKYRTRIVEAPLVKPYLREDRDKREINKLKGFLHVTAMHYNADETDRLLDKWSELKHPSDVIALAYGGPADQFAKIKHPCKFFVPQNEIWAVKRGGVNSYTSLVRQAAEICLSNDLDGMMYSDGDAWPCTDDYVRKLCIPPWVAGADFSAARLRDVTHTSFQFPECPDHSLPNLERWVRQNNFGDPNAPVRILFHAGPFMFFSSTILERFLQYCSDEPPIHDELAISTYMLYLGANYCAYEDFSVFNTDHWLRYRPNLSKNEFLMALEMKLPLAHPVKDNSWVDYM